jgi:hypothetical protein
MVGGISRKGKVVLSGSKSLAELCPMMKQINQPQETREGDGRRSHVHMWSIKQLAACSLGLSATSQQCFSLTTNQPPATSQQYFSLRTNQHQPSATRQTSRLWIDLFFDLDV